MTYVALARRGRPQLFSEVVGQEHVTKTLQNAVLSKRIAHAYLFTGPRGIGKTTVARILAKAVNCSETSSPEPCNRCPSCTEISTGRSVDVIEIDAASNRGIDEIRELRENVKFAPVTCKYKVYIIDEAHMLTTEAFNALLKTLEEPPPHVIFILATTEPNKILPTILSRCQRFDFRLLTKKEIVDRLKELLRSDNIIVDDDVLSLIAEAADGSLRDAEVMMDQVLSFSEGKLNVEDVSRFLGLGGYHLISKLVSSILRYDVAESLKLLDEMVRYGADLSQCLKKLITHFRDLIIYKVNPSLIDASDMRLRELSEQSKTVSVERLMKCAKLLTQVESDIKQFGHERVNLEIALVKLSKIRDDAIPLDKIISKLEEIESKIEAGAIISRPFSADNTYGVSEVVELEDLADRGEPKDPLTATWKRLLNVVKTKSIPLHSILQQANPVSFENGVLTISLDSKLDLYKEEIQRAQKKELNDEELSKLMRSPIKLRIKDAEGSKDQPTGELHEKDSSSAVMQDEMIQMVLKIFDGKIVEVRK